MSNDSCKFHYVLYIILIKVGICYTDCLDHFLMKVKEENKKAGLKLSIRKTKIMASGPIASWQIEGKKVEAVTDCIFLGSRITVDDDCSHEIKDTCSLEGKL